MLDLVRSTGRLSDCQPWVVGSDAGKEALGDQTSMCCITNMQSFSVVGVQISQQ